MGEGGSGPAPRRHGTGGHAQHEAAWAGLGEDRVG